MQTALRKIGNSTGMILPRAILADRRHDRLGNGLARRGRQADRDAVEEGRAGWQAAAAAVAATDGDGEAAWRGFGNEDDADLTW